MRWWPFGRREPPGSLAPWLKHRHDGSSFMALAKGHKEVGEWAKAARAFSMAAYWLEEAAFCAPVEEKEDLYEEAQAAHDEAAWAHDEAKHACFHRMDSL
jgi:hypothetical protein